jgi:hypothetical protein
MRWPSTCAPNWSPARCRWRRATTSSKKTALCLPTAAAKYVSGEYSATFAELELRQSAGHTRILLG